MEMNDTIKKNLEIFARQIEESNARDKRVLEQKQCHYYVFDYMDDSEMVYTEEDIKPFKESGQYCVTPFTPEQNEAQFNLIRKVQK